MLQDDMGNWVTDQNELKAIGVNFFQKLYAEDPELHASYPLCGWFPTCDTEILNNISLPFTDDEIKRALFQIKPWKSPGVDGLQAGFYQSQWHVVGSDLCREMKRILAGGGMSEEMNKTLICLIPKVEVPKSIAQFRPISLCTTTYKIATKAIANRLKAIMPLLVGPTQTSFVPGRHITENIIIAQEVIHSMRNKSGKHGFMAIKVDLEKAYDRIRWSFLYDALLEASIPPLLVSVIMNCISSSSMQLLWNGETTNSFRPSRGLRQGCPLSPYLFVLCMERLAHGIRKAVLDGNWTPIYLSRGGPALTHLFFADDLVLFAKADSNQVDVIKGVLQDFYICSGQKVSAAKTQVFFSKNISPRQKKDLSSQLGFRMTNDLGRYLGVPLLHSRVTKSTYHYLLDNMRQKIAKWNSTPISLAGRATLAQSVLLATPTYVMQTSKIPVSTCHELEKITRNFLWRGAENAGKLPLVTWSKVNNSKLDGGLGLRDLSSLNIAYCMKLCWKFLTSLNCLWVQVLRSKYKVVDRDPFGAIAPSSSTQFRRFMCANWEAIQSNAMWAHGNGRKARFWIDKWVPGLEGNLLAHAIINIPENIRDFFVSQFVMDNGSWNWDLFSHFLPYTILINIAAILPPSNALGEDTIFWAISSSGNFNLKSAYNSLMDGTDPDSRFPWKVIWQWPGSQKIKMFFWLLLNNGVMTNMERNHRHLAASPICPVCNLSSESGLHLLRDCYPASQFWQNIVPQVHLQWVFDENLSLDAWMIANLKMTDLAYGVPWNVLFGVSCWLIWKRRNGVVFSDVHKTIPELVKDVISEANLTVDAMKKLEFHCTLRRKHISVFWKCPPEIFFKMNSNASIKENSGHAFGGGLVRDARGVWQQGFVVNIGGCSILHAEIWCVLHGINLALSMGIKYLLVECDNKVAVDMINQKCNLNATCSGLIRSIAQSNELI